MKKICVINGSRSEYGLLKNIIEGIKITKIKALFNCNWLSFIK